jgi:glycyl-tRNA synthetase beta chain
MVGEFPELQGIMGYYYAKEDQLGEEIAAAIRDHYKPQGSSDSLPVGDAAILAIADKLDSLVGLILIGEEPSGSRDPYSLRRQALGIIRIILGNRLSINIKQLVAYVVHLYQTMFEDVKGGGDDSGLNKTRQIILDFLEERAKYYFKNHYDLSLINAVLDFDIEEDLVVSEIKLASLQEFLTKADGENLLTIYKRTNNILEGSNIEGEVNQDAFISKYEQELFLSLGVISKQIDSYIVEKDFTKTLSLLLEILNPVNEFFDNVMVKDQDHNIANNRLLLLRMVTQLFDKLAKFSFL